MKKTRYGIFAMIFSLLLGFVIALGSLGALGGKLNTRTLTSQAISIPTILISCLDPLTIGLEILAILLILMDSRNADNPQRTLAWMAAGSFILWAALNLGGFLPLSFIGMRRGSLEIVKIGQIVKASAALLQYTVPFLLIYGLTRGRSRAMLWMALLLSIVGNFGVVILTISQLKLEQIDTLGQTFYTPVIQIDYTRGIYPFLLILGYLGGVIYLTVYGSLWFQKRKKHHQVIRREAAT